MATFPTLDLNLLLGKGAKRQPFPRSHSVACSHPQRDVPSRNALPFFRSSRISFIGFGTH
jgi:hypothetical protein